MVVGAHGAGGCWGCVRRGGGGPLGRSLGGGHYLPALPLSALTPPPSPLCAVGPPPVWCVSLQVLLRERPRAEGAVRPGGRRHRRLSGLPLGLGYHRCEGRAGGAAAREVAGQQGRAGGPSTARGVGQMPAQGLGGVGMPARPPARAHQARRQASPAQPSPRPASGGCLSGPSHKQTLRAHSPSTPSHTHRHHVSRRLRAVRGQRPEHHGPGQRQQDPGPRAAECMRASVSLE